MHKEHIVIVLLTMISGFGFGWYGYNLYYRLPEKKMVVIIPSYNNKKWCERNLASVFAQKYDNYRVVYIDDCSTDDTYWLVKKTIDNHKQSDRVTLIRNKERQGAMANWYHAVHACDDDEIIINLDGDDWLENRYVLQRVNREYHNGAWMTYGQFKYYPAGTVGYGSPVPQDIIENNAYRWYPVVPTHLRTFYAWLFKKIKTEDCMHEGQFFPTTCDQAMMFPMLEMAGKHAHFIPDILYVYNQANPLNDGKLREQMVVAFEHIIRSKDAYELINSFSCAPSYLTS